MKTFPFDPDLIARAQTGDRDAFNQLVLQYQDAVYQYSAFLTHDPDLAADVTQESFIKAFQHIRSLKGGSFRPWLFKVVTNAVRDLAHRSTRHPMRSLHPRDENGEENDSPAWLIDPDASVEAAVQQHETSRQLTCLINELSIEHRSILILVDLQGMDYGETAQILNIPLGTVKSRLARARLQMKNKLLGGDEHTRSLKKDASIAAHMARLPVGRARTKATNITQCQQMQLHL